MRSILTFLAAGILIVSCKKDDKTVAGATTNNNTTVISTNVPAYTVDGVHDIQLSRVRFGWGLGTSFPITVQFHDSAQQRIKISVTNVPSGMQFSTANSSTETGPWWGYPTFSLPLVGWCTSDITPLGKYNVILTSEDTSGRKKSFPFTVEVVN
jgi:hypothetical protein